MRLAVAIMLACSACTVEREVLSEQITTCAQALAGQSGQACAFEGTCTQPALSNTKCCTDTAYCRQARLVLDHKCNPDCSPCTDDSQCQHGAAICNGTVCEPCPQVSCSMCPTSWVHLERNGCPTCTCAPPATCSAGTPCIAATCYRGAQCAPGCSANAALGGCCSNQCAAAGCSNPIPVGCLAACSPAQTTAGCTTCAADHCTCSGGNWKCTTICADNHAATCIAPTAVITP